MKRCPCLMRPQLDLEIKERNSEAKVEECQEEESYKDEMISVDNEELCITLKRPESTDTTMSELERLQMHQICLENKVYEMEKKLSATGVKKSQRDSYRLQISNAEQKQRMLAKRIAYEKKKLEFTAKATSPSPERKTLLTNLSGKSPGIYVNSVNSQDVLAKMEARAQNLQEKFWMANWRDREVYFPESTEMGNYGKWKRLDAGDDTGQIDRQNHIIPRGRRFTTTFFPPIPSPEAKKRPLSALSQTERSPSKVGEKFGVNSKNPNEKGIRLRLIPNARRVAKNRGLMLEKQLEFAKKYGLENKDILENLADSQEILYLGSTWKDSGSHSGVTREQLYLMGSLSREFLNNDIDVI